MRIDLIKEVRKKVSRQYWLLFGIIALFIIIVTAISELVNSFTYLASSNLFGAYILVYLLISATIILISGPFEYSLSSIFLRVSKNEEVRFSDAFLGFNERFGKSIGLVLLRGLKIFLWSLLLIIPGIVKSYAYSMSFYIMIEKPDLPVGEAIRQSDAMMQGHKGELFIFQLSLILYYLPAIALYFVSFFMIRNGNFIGGRVFSYLSTAALVFVAPLANCVQSDFYYMLKGEYMHADGELVDETL